MTRFEAWRNAGREVSIAGLARSGTAAARLLVSRGIRAYLSDGGDTPSLRAAASDLQTTLGEMISIEVGRHDLDRVARSAALVLSPGIPPEAAVVRAARDAGVPVLAEAQLGLDALPAARTVAVTGTNGKTTTTAMIDHLMQVAGRRSAAAGNIGRPLSDIALEVSPPDWLAVELSSFQLHDMPDVAPMVGVLTNLAPDHLDRYATLAEYYADKARLFANATDQSIWVENGDDAASGEMLRHRPGRRLRFTVSGAVPADGWYDRTRDQLMLGERSLLARTALPLLGDHNVANALAAAVAVHATGVDIEVLAAGLASFQPLHHRMEVIREVDGVLWINDSKATNVASTRVALEAMTRPYVLLLGGRHKGEPYTDLVGPLCRGGLVVIAYGEAAELIEHDLLPSIRVVRGTTFDDVVNKARLLAPAGGAVLLSPACSSYDMFDNYEQRGAVFRALVEAM